jgi:hypothetical protein
MKTKLREIYTLLYEKLKLKEGNYMRIIIKTLWRTVILLVCSVIQGFAVIFQGIGMMFENVGKFLLSGSAWMLKRLDKGKFENEMRTIAETAT